MSLAPPPEPRKKLACVARGCVAVQIGIYREIWEEVIERLLLWWQILLRRRALPCAPREIIARKAIRRGKSL